jgi:TDG/mug DNA glycosylase family protein
MLPVASSQKSGSATGFAPIAAPDARVLVLGSLPSQLSLKRQQYFGNPQNVFWRIMGDLFGAGPELPYPERAMRLSRCGVAVWDVLGSAVRPGSMDADIDMATAKPNDFQTFFATHTQLELLCFNGKKAAQLYRTLVAAKGIGSIDGLEHQTMPSTSPAYAAMSYADKLRHWSVIEQHG